MDGQYIILNTSSDLLRIAATELVYAQADGNYTTIVLADGYQHVVTLQLGQLERLIAQQMPHAAAGFVRIGKSLIVSLAHVRYIHPSHGVLTLRNPSGKAFTLSASHEALKSLKNLIGKE